MKKLLRLSDEPWIIADVEAVEDAVLGEPDCILLNPVTVEGEPWPKYSKDTQVAVRSSDILVMVEPSDEITKKFLTE